MTFRREPRRAFACCSCGAPSRIVHCDGDLQLFCRTCEAVLSYVDLEGRTPAEWRAAEVRS